MDYVALHLAMRGSAEASLDAPRVRVERFLPGGVSIPYHRKHVQAYVFQNQAHMIVAFRGTELVEPDDLATDLDYKKVTLPNIPGTLHRGFVAAFDWVAMPLFTHIERERKHRKLWLTGHSLGGALAQVMALRLLGQQWIDGVYTFGSPRVMSRAAAKFLSWNLQDRLVRIETWDDPVPHLPLFLLNFRHAGQPYVFGPDGVLRTGRGVYLRTHLAGLRKKRRHYGHARLIYVLLVTRFLKAKTGKR